jgi:hypothetical protein
MQWFYPLFLFTASVYLFVLLRLPARIVHRMAFIAAWVFLTASLTIAPIFSVVTLLGNSGLAIMGLSVLRELLVGISLLCFLYATLPPDLRPTDRE